MSKCNRLTFNIGFSLTRQKSHINIDFAINSMINVMMGYVKNLIHFHIGLYQKTVKPHTLKWF